jgi:hypothetical protein
MSLEVTVKFKVIISEISLDIFEQKETIKIFSDD